MILRTLLTLTVFCFPFTTWASEFSLPIWKEKAEALGYELPKPIGFNLSYMTMEQGSTSIQSLSKAWVNCHCNYKRIQVDNIPKC